MSLDKRSILILFPMAVLLFGRMDLSKAQSAIRVVVPNNLEHIEVNTIAGFPFDGFHGSMRYQQLFDASQFSAISNGGGLIGTIEFRLDGNCRTGDGQSVPNLQINLSTISKGLIRSALSLTRMLGSTTQSSAGLAACRTYERVLTSTLYDSIWRVLILSEGVFDGLKIGNFTFFALSPTDS